MRAFEIRDDNPDGVAPVKVTRERPDCGPEAALVRVRAAALNHRDLVIADPARSFPGTDLPIIPLSDGAGEVVAVGRDVDRLSVGDRVIAPFAPDCVDGPPTRAKIQRTTGANVDGCLAEYTTFPAESLVRIPPYLSYVQAATLPCAALTAWRALVENGSLASDETVLVLGTGGVATFAVRIAQLRDARIVLVASSGEQLQQVIDIDPVLSVDYKRTPEWGSTVADRVGGVDHVVEVGGVGTLEQSLTAAGFGGQIHLIGSLAGREGTVRPQPILPKTLTVRGIVGTGSRAMTERMLNAFESATIAPVIDRIFPFAEAPAAYRYLGRGAYVGKVAIRIE